jgi:hypothetical protein
MTGLEIRAFKREDENERTEEEGKSNWRVHTQRSSPGAGDGCRFRRRINSGSRKTYPFPFLTYPFLTARFLTYLYPQVLTYLAGRVHRPSGADQIELRVGPQLELARLQNQLTLEASKPTLEVEGVIGSGTLARRSDYLSRSLEHLPFSREYNLYSY